MAAATLAPLGRSHPQWDLLVTHRASARSSTGLTAAVQRGDTLHVLSSSPARHLVSPFAGAAGASLHKSSPLTLDGIDITVDDSLEQGAATDVLAVAVAALHAFVQANWTGPDLPDELRNPVKLLRRTCPDVFPARKVDERGDEQGAEDGDDRLDDLLRFAALDRLTCAGEPAYHLCASPLLLVLSLRILEALERSHCKQHIPSLPWWTLRATSIHSRILDTPIAPSSRLMLETDRLRSELEKESLSAQATGEGDDDGSFYRGLCARLLVDQGLALQRGGKEREANERLVRAAQASGLRYEITGALGKQTKFQKEDKTILVLKAESAGSRGDAEALSATDRGTETKDSAAVAGMGSEKFPLENTSGWKTSTAPNGDSDMPSELLHNDDTLLERTRFTSSAVASNEEHGSQSSSLAHVDVSNPSPLDPLDSAILLGLCLNISNAAPENGLTASEMSAFVTRVLAHARNWSVHTMALLLRSRLEAHRTRTAQRAALQLQALVDQMPTEDSSVEERLRLVHELELPSKWDMQAELARRYASLGVIHSALEIFERIELWQEAVQCLGVLGRQDKAIEVVRDLLQGRKVETDEAISARKTPLRDEQTQQRLNKAREAKLWCLLGDLEVDHAKSHYTKAWEVSQQSSARAARSLGGAAFAVGDMDSAILWLRRGLRIQPLLARSWFMLGCAFMRQDTSHGWLEAARCFRRCTALDDEDAESWNNLASCYLRLGQQSQSILREAARAEQSNAETDQRAVLADLDEHSDSESDAGSHLSSDSGVGMASSGSDTETETETEAEGEGPEDAAEAFRMRQVSAAAAATAAVAGGGGGSTAAFDVKLLAHKALVQALRFSHDDWRVWNNLMIVSVDCGLLNDAVRAMARVVEIKQSPRAAQSQDGDIDVVDIAVLNRIVDAVTRAPSRETDAIASAEPEDSRGGAAATATAVTANTSTSGAIQTKVRHNPHEGHGLWPAVRSLFDNVLLPRISSSAPIWRAHARLMLWRGCFRTALEAHLAAWRTSYGAEASEVGVTTDRTEWLQAIDALQELCELLENFGERDVVIDADGDECDGYEAVGSSGTKQELAMANWRFRARSVVRTFMGRTKDAFESDPAWNSLVDLRNSLAPSAGA